MRYKDLFEEWIDSDEDNLAHEILSHHGLTRSYTIPSSRNGNRFHQYNPPEGMYGHHQIDKEALLTDLHGAGWAHRDDWKSKTDTDFEHSLHREPSGGGSMIRISGYGGRVNSVRHFPGISWQPLPHGNK